MIFMKKETWAWLRCGVFMALFVPFLGCSDNDKVREESVFHVSSASFTNTDESDAPVMIFPAEGGIAYIDFETNLPWHVENVPSWSRVTPAEGGPGAVRITVNVLPNEESDSRSQRLVLKTTDTRLEIVLFQSRLTSGMAS